MTTNDPLIRDPADQAGHPSRMKLDLYILKELDAEDRKRVASHLRECDECTARMAAMQIQLADAGRMDDWGDLCARLELPKTRPASGFPWRLAVPFAAAALAAWLIIAPPWKVLRGPGAIKPPPTQLQPSGIKGEPQLLVHLKTDSGSRIVRSGEKLRPGDRIRLVYSNPGYRYLMLLSISRSGRIAPIYPADKKSSISVRTGHQLELPGSLTLDNSAESELLLAIFSAEALHFSRVSKLVRREFERVSRLDALTELKVPGWVQASHLIHKRPK